MKSLDGYLMKKVLRQKQPDDYYYNRQSGWLPDEEGIKTALRQVSEKKSLDGYLMKKVLRQPLTCLRDISGVWMVT